MLVRLRSTTLPGRRAATAVRFVETTVDALLALAAFAVTGLVATVAILWLVPLLLAAAIAASLGDA